LTHLYRLTLVFLCAALGACASTLSPDTLQSPSRPGETIEVREFVYDGGFGLLAGTYVVEFEDATGYYHRGPGNVYRMPAFLNHNKAEYPDSVFPGGLFISKTSGNEKPVYRTYFYALHNSPGAKLDATTTQQTVAATVPKAGVVPSALGGAIAGALLEAAVKAEIGQIRLMPATSSIDIGAFVSRPAR
jgi:hypothetical protein